MKDEPWLNIFLEVSVEINWRHEFWRNPFRHTFNHIFVIISEGLFSFNNRGYVHIKWWFSKTCGQVHLPQKQHLIYGKYINTQLAKAWTAINRFSVLWKSDLSDKIKRNFFQAVVVSVLLYRYATWMLTKHIEKILDGNCTRILQVILTKSWKEHSTKQQLYGH